MGVKNFETGVLVQKFDQGIANCVHFFFQKRTITRRPLALECFTPTKFAKTVFLQHKGNAVWSQNQISAKNPKTFSEILHFREILLQVCCHVSRIKKSRFFRKNSTFLVQKTFFWKVRFQLNSVTNLIFFKNAKLQYITPAASTWFYFDIMNMGGKEWKQKCHVIVVASFFQNYHLSSIERNLVIPKWTRKIFRPEVWLNVIRFYIMTENVFWLRIFLVVLR